MSEITRENWPEMKRQLAEQREREEYDWQLRQESEEKIRIEAEARRRADPQQFTIGELYRKYDEWVETLSDEDDEYWESEKERASMVYSFLYWLQKHD